MDDFSDLKLSEVEPVSAPDGEWRVGLAPHPQGGDFPQLVMAEAPDYALFMLMPVIGDQNEISDFMPVLVSENGTYIPASGIPPTERPIPEATLNAMRHKADPLKTVYAQLLSEGKGKEGSDFIRPLDEAYANRWQQRIRSGSALENQANILAQNHFQDLSYTGGSFSERIDATTRQRAYNEAMDAEQREVVGAAQDGIEMLEDFLSQTEHSPETANEVIARHQGEKLAQQAEARLKHHEEIIRSETERGIPAIEKALGQEANASHVRRLQAEQRKGNSGPDLR